MYIPSLLLLSFSLCASQLEIGKEPFAIAYLPNFELVKHERIKPRFASDRSRMATCSGVDWFFDNHYIATLHLVGSALQTYAFNPLDGTLIPFESFERSEGDPLGAPLNLSFSKDRNLLAITNALNGEISVYRTDPHQNKLPSKPTATYSEPLKVFVHGVRFSPDSSYLIYANFGARGHLTTLRVVKDEEGKISLIKTQKLKNRLDPLRIKGLDFSQDGSLLATTLSLGTGKEPVSDQGAIVIYRFDQTLGQLDPTPLFSKIGDPLLSSPEDILFYPDGSALLISNQGNDTLVKFPINLETGELGEGTVVLSNPNSQLSFPHGIAFSTDGRFLAVCHYGDNKVTIYPVTERD